MGDEKTGILLSEPFRIYSDRISFLIGGGCGKGVRLELLINGKAVRTATGDCDESMVRKSWMVDEFKGRMAELRAVDEETGGWGHLNFDDIKFSYL